MGELLGQTIVVENIGARRRHGRRAARRQGGARRLHVPDRQYRHARLQPVALQEAALQRRRPISRRSGWSSESPRILLARKDLPVNNLQEFVAYVKANQSQDAVRLGRRRLGHAPALRAAELGARRQGHARALSRRRAGDAGPDRRPHRLHVRHHPDRRAAGQGGHREGHRHDGAQARADHRRARDHRRAGPAGVEATVWNAFFLPQGHARSDRAQAQQGDERHASTMPAMRKRLEELGLDIVPPEQRTPEYLANTCRRRSSAGAR